MLFCCSLCCNHFSCLFLLAISASTNSTTQTDLEPSAAMNSQEPLRLQVRSTGGDVVEESGDSLAPVKSGFGRRVLGPALQLWKLFKPRPVCDLSSSALHQALSLTSSCTA